MKYKPIFSSQFKPYCPPIPQVENHWVRLSTSPVRNETVKTSILWASTPPHGSSALWCRCPPGARCCWVSVRRADPLPPDPQGWEEYSTAASTPLERDAGLEASSCGWPLPSEYPETWTAAGALPDRLRDLTRTWGHTKFKTTWSVY